VAFLENYAMQCNMAKFLVQGSTFGSTPRVFPWRLAERAGKKPHSNGAMNLSVLDGWWKEGYNGANGWGIEPLVGTKTFRPRTSMTRNSSTACWSKKPFLSTINENLTGYPAAGCSS